MSKSEPIGPRVLVLGSECAFSAIVVRSLVENGADVCGFVVRDPHPRHSFEPRRKELPVVVEGLGPAVALEAGVPVVEVASTHDAEAAERVAAYRPDMMLVACFPMLLDARWRAIPRDMCLNLHPSILPSYRGPTPLFWQFRAGERETGITLHVVDAAVDAGDIVAQTATALPAGARFSEVNAALAAIGAELVLDLIERRRAGIEIPCTAQDESLASYRPFPKGSDFRFDTHFTAERAYRFVQGAREWGVPFEVDAGDRTFVIEHALDFHDTARMSAPYVVEGERVRIRFAEGELEAIARPVPQS